MYIYYPCSISSSYIRQLSIVYHVLSFNLFIRFHSTPTYTVAKKVSHKVLFIYLSNIDRLSNFFTGEFCGKFVIKWILNITPQ